jgi:hypothetical protein
LVVHLSKEARKAEIEETAVLWTIVGVDERVYNILVGNSLGYLLDEQAIESQTVDV